MGSEKDWMSRMEDCKGIAEEVCVRAKVLARCDCCDGVYDPLAGDWAPAYKLGNHLINKNDALVATLNGNRKLLQESIKELEDTPRECECKQRMRSDD